MGASELGLGTAAMRKIGRSAEKRRAERVAGASVAKEALVCRRDRLRARAYRMAAFCRLTGFLLVRCMPQSDTRRLCWLRQGPVSYRRPYRQPRAWTAKATRSSRHVGLILH